MMQNKNMTADKQVDMASIISSSFNSIQVAMIAKLKTSSSHNSAVILHKVDTGS